MQVRCALLWRRHLRAVPEQVPEALGACPDGMGSRLEEESWWHEGQCGAGQS